MALKKLTLRPGINKEGTSYSNEDGFYNSDKIRFRSGYAEKIGGWQNIGAYTYVGVARSIWTWVSLTSETLTGIGTSQKFYIESGSKYYDITPIRSTSSLDSPYFSTSVTNPLIVRVDDIAHGATPGTYVTFTKAYTTLTNAIASGTTSAITVGSTTGFPASGTIQIDNEIITYTGVSATQLGTSSISRGQLGTVTTAHVAGVYVVSLQSISVGGVNLQGSFEILTTSQDYYTISIPSPATSTATGGSGTYAIYDINASKGAAILTYGWGAGGWGVLAWGSDQPASTATTLRLWSQTNYDQDLMFAPRGGSIYWWTKDTQGYSKATTLNAYANTQIKTPASTTATWLLGASSITVNDVTGINFGAIVTGTGIPAGAYVSPDWDQSTLVPLILKQNTPAVTTAAGTNAAVSFSYSGNHIPYQTFVIATSSQNAFTIAFGASSYNPRMLETPAVFLGGNGLTSTTTLTISSTISGSLYAGMEISGDGITPGTTLVSGSGTSWVMSAPMSIATGTTITAIAPFDPLLVRWSDQDKPWEWVPALTNQSGEIRLSNGSKIIAANNTRQEILVWTDTALYTMQYLGGDLVYGINLLMDNLSIASQNAAITVNNVTYWMGVDRFYSYSGRVETLPCTLRQFIYNNINKSQLGLITCGTNEGFNEIWWFYPSANSPSNDRYVVYNHLEQVWYYGTIYRSSWLDTQLKDYPLGAFSTERMFLAVALTNTTSTTIQLNDVSTLPSSGVVTVQNEAISYTTVNYANNTISGGARGVNGTVATTHSINSPVIYSVSNQLLFHEVGYDDLSSNTPLPIYSYIESSDFDIDDGLNFSYVWRIIPDLSFSGSTASSPKCYLTVKTRQNSGSAYNIDPSDPINDPYDRQAVYRTATSPVEQYTGQVYVRVRGRQMAFRMESTDLGVFWQMGMMRIDIRQDGRR